MTTADVNWMLGATVQSGAALVAIVGGLLGSRYVALDAEQQSARRRLKQVEGRLESARAQAEDAKEALAKFRVRDLLDKEKCYEAIWKAKGQLQVDQFLDDADLDGKDVPRDALEEHFRVLCEEILLAMKTLNDLVGDWDEHGEWGKVRRLHGIETRNDGAWEWAYEEVDERVARYRHEREQKQRESTAFGMAIGLPYFPTRVFNAADAAATKTLVAEMSNRLAIARDSANTGVAQLEGELHAALIHVGEVAQPEGFGLALSVLTYIGLVSIAVPTALMVSGLVALPPWARIAVAALFLSGVALLLRYLYVYAAYLGNRSRRGSLPRSLFGLLRTSRGRRAGRGAP